MTKQDVITELELKIKACEEKSDKEYDLSYECEGKGLKNQSNRHWQVATQQMKIARAYKNALDLINKIE